MITAFGSSWKQIDKVKSNQFHIQNIFEYKENIRNITQNYRSLHRKTANCHSKVICHASASINLTLKQLDNTSTRVINEQGIYIYSHLKHLLQLNLSQTRCSNHKLFHRQNGLEAEVTNSPSNAVWKDLCHLNAFPLECARSSRLDTHRNSLQYASIHFPLLYGQ